MLSRQFFRPLLGLFPLFGDPFVLRVLDVLFGGQVLDRVVGHDTDVVHECVVRRPADYGIYLGRLSQVDLMDGANAGYLGWIDFNE